MIYLKEVQLNCEPQPTRWPYTIPAFQGIDKITFDSPVTFFCGENGSGKSTLLEALAVKLQMPAVGRKDAARDETLFSLRPFAKRMKVSQLARPTLKLFMRSEDFFNFVRGLQQEQLEMKQELERVEEEYKGRSVFTQQQARMAYTSVLGSMESRYGEDLLEQASHGESFLRLFQERFHPNGLYFLDEPEAPLSPLRQMTLLSLIKEMAEENCQFVIVTHSPILLALPGAAIYSFDSQPLQRTSYDELESVNLLRSFLQMPERFIRNL